MLLTRYICLILLGFSPVLALRKPLFHAKTFRQPQCAKNIRCTAVETGDGGKINVDVEVYLGPSSTADEMEAGCSIEDLGAAIEVSDVRMIQDSMTEFIISHIR